MRTDLPRDQWQAIEQGREIAIAMHTVQGALQWTRFRRDALPNDQITADDLKRMGIKPRAKQS